ncbi:unnamed protein product [Alopecurus aequalis]
MKAGRKNLQRACQDGSTVTLAEGESIMQVLTLRGSNLIEVKDSKGVESLALFPAKFQKSVWIKSGNYVVVDASGRDEALESGSKIGCVVSRVLFHDQVRALEKLGECCIQVNFEQLGDRDRRNGIAGRGRAELRL